MWIDERVSHMTWGRVRDPVVLGIDVGNSDIKMGCICGKNVQRVFRFATQRMTTAKTISNCLNDVVLRLGLRQMPPLFVSSVVPDVSMMIKEVAHSQSWCVHWMGTGDHLGFEVPETIAKDVGSDILMAAEAGVRFSKSSVIIVSLGTATAVFAVHCGTLMGGAIAPGVTGSVETLVSRAALLQGVNIEKPHTVMGQDTTTAIRSGVIFGFASLVDGLVMRIKEELGCLEIPVIATGGWAGKIVPASRTVQAVFPNLVLQGIAFLSYDDSLQAVAKPGTDRQREVCGYETHPL